MGQNKLTEPNPPDQTFAKSQALSRQARFKRLSNLQGKEYIFNTLQCLTPGQIQEEERRRISESLHNNLGQLLYVLKLKLSKLSSTSWSEKDLAEKKEIEVLLDAALETTKNISFELMPHMLKTAGLKATIEELARKSSSPDLYISTKITCQNRFTSAFEISVYRIVQELINNIIKHSGASFAEISFQKVDNIIELTVSDNGVGFDLQAVNKGQSMGLQWINYHISVLRGNFLITSAPGKGTTVEIKLKG